MNFWLAALTLTLVGSGSAQATQETAQETFRFETKVSNVYVDAFVTHKGRSVQGLTAADFEVLDKGVRQNIRLVSPETMPLSAVLVLDTSGSVYGSKLADLRSGAHAFIDGLRQMDETALLRFSHRVSMGAALGSEPKLLHQAIDRPTLGGFTAIFDALYAGLIQAESGTGRPLLLLFTDGDDNASWLRESEILDMVRESEIIIYVVRIDLGSGVYAQPIVGKTFVDNETAQAKMLRRIVESTGGRVLAADSGNLKTAFVEILEEVQNRYILYFEPQGVATGGWHELEVKLRNRKGDIRARSGYVAGGEH